MSMNKKEYMVVDHTGLHDYDLTVVTTDEGDVFSLFLSMGEQWNESVKGKLVLSMINNGNGVKFDRKLKNLDYSELVYLRILLNFEHMTDAHELNREKYRVIEMSDEILV